MQVARVQPSAAAATGAHVQCGTASRSQSNDSVAQPMLCATQSHGWHVALLVNCDPLGALTPPPATQLHHYSLANRSLTTHSPPTQLHHSPSTHSPPTHHSHSPPTHHSHSPLPLTTHSAASIPHHPLTTPTHRPLGCSASCCLPRVWAIRLPILSSTVGGTEALLRFVGSRSIATGGGRLVRAQEYVHLPLHTECDCCCILSAAAAY